MEFIRVEVKKIEKEDLPPFILPRTGGHRRVYTYTEFGIHYLMNVMCIGDTTPSVAYGEADFQITNQKPEIYFEKLSPIFLSTALDRWKDDLDANSVAFLGVIDPKGDHPLTEVNIIDRQHELNSPRLVY